VAHDQEVVSLCVANGICFSSKSSVGVPGWVVPVEALLFNEVKTNSASCVAYYTNTYNSRCTVEAKVKLSRYRPKVA
jgi:hypothetical protein